MEKPGKSWKEQVISSIAWVVFGISAIPILFMVVGTLISGTVPLFKAPPSNLPMTTWTPSISSCEWSDYIVEFWPLVERTEETLDRTKELFEAGQNAPEEHNIAEAILEDLENTECYHHHLEVTAKLALVLKFQLVAIEKFNIEELERAINFYNEIVQEY